MPMQATHIRPSRPQKSERVCGYVCVSELYAIFKLRFIEVEQNSGGIRKKVWLMLRFSNGFL